MIFYNSDLKCFSPSLINGQIFFSGFSTKDLGDGVKRETIINFLKNNEVDYKQLVVLNQIHSTNISVVNRIKDSFLKVEDTDGAITNQPKTVLMTRSADCLPIVFCDLKTGLIGVSHQGWRGSIKQMAVKMVEEMVANGGSRQSIVAAIGPGINQCCYDIDDDRYYQFLEELDGYSDKVFLVHHGKKYLNLSMLNYLQLIKAGISKKNIDYFPFCTKCDKKRFFSYRRDKKAEFGEMFSFIMRYN